MADITLISGSTLGSAEYVAEHLAEKLEAAGFTTETLHGPELDELTLSGRWLVVSSTHGAGDLPDNLQPLLEQIEEQLPDFIPGTVRRSRFGQLGIRHFLWCDPTDRRSSDRSRGEKDRRSARDRRD
jgi:flavodoxin